MSDWNFRSILKSAEQMSFGKAGGLWASIFGIALVVGFCWNADTIFRLLALTGAVLGWLLGVLVAPLNDREAKDFNVFIKVISGFITGYLLSKVDPLLAYLLAINPDTHAPVLAEKEVAERVLITLSSFGISLLTVFSIRAYWPGSQIGSKLPVIETQVLVGSTPSPGGAAARP
jgi:hypothetical protein